MKRILFSISIVLFLSILFVGCSGTRQSSTGTEANPPSDSETLDGKTLVETRCTECHNLDRATSFSGSADEWTKIVDNMVEKGANLNNSEKDVVINYLAETYP